MCAVRRAPGWKKPGGRLSRGAGSAGAYPGVPALLAARRARHCPARRAGLELEADGHPTAALSLSAAESLTGETPIRLRLPYLGSTQLLVRLGFDTRAVISLRVSVADDPDWALGHTWLSVRVGAETRDVCAGHAVRRRLLSAPDRRHRRRGWDADQPPAGQKTGAPHPFGSKAVALAAGDPLGLVAGTVPGGLSLHRHPDQELSAAPPRCAVQRP